MTIIMALHGFLLASLILCCKTCSIYSWLCVCHSRTTKPAMQCMLIISLAAYRLPATFFRASSSYVANLMKCIQSAWPGGSLQYLRPKGICLLVSYMMWVNAIMGWPQLIIWQINYTETILNKCHFVYEIVTFLLIVAFCMEYNDNPMLKIYSSHTLLERILFKMRWRHAGDRMYRVSKKALFTI